MDRSGEARALAELVRLPAVLSVPGDVLLGAAAGGGRPRPARLAALCAASSCLYLGGMALNDWADREVDAVERPARPVPSGRVGAGTALRVAAGLTAAGLATAAAAGGARSLAAAAPVAAAAWTYDLAAKATPAGPAVMGAARALDVLLGASTGRPARALSAAAVVGAHTAVVTALSRHEVAGASPAAGRAALAGTGAVTTAAAWLVARWGPPAGRLGPALGLLAAYAVTVGAAQDRARRRPDPATVQRAVGAGVLGLLPLEAGLLAAAGHRGAAAAVAATWPVARGLARRRSVT